MKKKLNRYKLIDKLMSEMGTDDWFDAFPKLADGIWEEISSILASCTDRDLLDLQKRYIR